MEQKAQEQIEGGIAKQEMQFEQHCQRHFELHHAFDELAADYMIHNPGCLLSKTSLMDLLQWSFKQTTKPTVKDHPEGLQIPLLRTIGIAADTWEFIFEAIGLQLEEGKKFEDVLYISKADGVVYKL